MQFSEVIQALRFLLLVFLCFALLSVAPCMSSLLCLDGSEKSLVPLHPIRRYFTEDDPASTAVAAASKAYLSPVVFRGTLTSVVVQKDGAARAAFSVDKVLKVPAGLSALKSGELEVVYFSNLRTGKEDCVLDVNEENLQLGKQYLVFGRSLEGMRWSITATAFPIAFEKRTFRAAKRVVCKGCAKPPRIEGLKNVRIAERRKLRLNCHLSGNPIPWVEWYKDGQPIQGNGRVKVRTKRRTSRLTIRQSRFRDRGVYECRAVNVVQDTPVAVKAVVTVTKKSTTKKPQPPSTTTTASSLWPTEDCPNSEFCLNGGTCTFYRDVREYVCHCAEGFVGLRCDYKDVRASLGGTKNYRSRGAIP